mgnify:FL=1
MQGIRRHHDRLPNVDVCPIPNRHGEPCGKPSPQMAPFAICGRHAREVYDYFSQFIDGVTHDPVFRAKLALDWVEDERRKVPAAPAPEAVVYYVQIGKLIKIGYTEHIRKRMQQYPPTRRLLATEPGTPLLERRRHAQFTQYLSAGREWFDPGSELLRHIEQLRERVA